MPINRFLIFLAAALSFLWFQTARAQANDDEVGAQSTTRIKAPTKVIESEEEDLNSNFYSPPKAKEFRRDISMGVNQSTYEFSGGGRATTFLSNIKLDFSYGLSEYVAISSEFSFATGEERIDTNTTTQGLEDIGLTLALSRPLKNQPAIFRYGVDATLSPGKYVEDEKFNSNRFTGGHWVAPYIGGEMRADSGIYGVKIGHEFPTRKRAISQQGETNYFDGGETTHAIVFYERKINDKITLLPRLEYTRTNRQDFGSGEIYSAVTPVYTLALSATIEQGKFSHTPSISYVLTPDRAVEGAEVLGLKSDGVEVDYHLGF